jgi:hypothetical protein
MSENRRFFTRTRLGLALWVTTMILLVIIPERYWANSDLWVRILVMVPMWGAIGLFLFDEATKPARDPRTFFFDRRTLWRDLEVILVTVVVGGIVWWKFKIGS